MLNSVQIINSLSNCEKTKEYKIKENIEDFVVQEVVSGKKCIISPLLDLEKYHEAESLLKDMPTLDLTKEDRKNIYSIVNYYPFKRLITKEGKLHIENNTNDVFVFTLLKYDYSANSLINLLARRLEVYSNCIQTGGTKDKRGITLQEISVNCSFEKLFSYAVSLSQNTKLKYAELGHSDLVDVTNTELIKEIEKHIKVENYETTEDIAIFNIRRGPSKKLGDLDGNFFTIKIRGLFGYDCKPNTKFLNYFGAQRFGISFNNHIVGECILNEKYDEALDIILNDGQQLNSTQRSILKLREAKNNPKYIVSRIPRHIKMIYLHAYQSFVFNQAINDRYERNSSLVSIDKVLLDNEYVEVNGTEALDKIYLPLCKMNDKLLKGGYRKMVEEMQGLTVKQDDDGTIFQFFLNKSSYATIALRDLIGDFKAISFE